MKPKKFSINFIHRPEFFYAAFELELKIEGKNICEFTVDGKIEKDTANLIFLSDWFENNLEYILNENDEFPLNIQGNSGIEITERFYNNILNIEDKDIDVAYEWCEKHLWTFSGIEMMLPDVVFRRIKNKIEISWDSTDKYKDNKNYKIEFTNLKGKSFIKIEEFKKEILKFIEKIKNIYKIITDKMKSIFYGEYFNSEYLYKREETNNLQENFLKEINNLGYNFNTIYDLILLEKKHKNVIPIFKKYLKLFDLDTRKNLVRFLGVKGFDEIIPLLENEFLENVDKEYRISIINSLRLIENDEIAKDYLKKLMKI
ncbi:Uncharacterised protein [uncultured Leptotrichia sp.]|uniref:hypothetical protein n=1 Tax=uncultured Leptotrichia sp. TaxID=159271 RepID=UPI001A4778C7|nr:hypothetical protein [uncultured Leptotrichia sp.]VTX50220.1 Uncharacterised protein [uncultured Leptotrichia sp.]